jgi:anthranilate synthase component 1
MLEPDFKQFSRLARPGAVVPVARRITADLLTPVSAYLSLARRQKLSFLLESVEGGEKIARYSFMGVNPYLRLRYRDSAAELVPSPSLSGPGFSPAGRPAKKEGALAPEVSSHAGNLFDELRRFTRAHRPVVVPGLPPFTSGAVGYMTYDVVRLLERLPERAPDDLKLPDAQFLFF